MLNNLEAKSQRVIILAAGASYLMCGYMYRFGF